ncbi:hypothetical protein KFE98_02600 [bacterium SCSIO 12741]|nr:hypothetical protein KFE98_02600 [bacterium SCSIO 12741]
MKSIVKYTAIAAILYAGLVGTAFLIEANQQKKYLAQFNSYREAQGIPLLYSFKDTTSENWLTHIQNHPGLYWKWILTNSEIGTRIDFANYAKDQPYHASKSLFFANYLFFWDNYYAGENDVFINPLDDSTEVSLNIWYISKEFPDTTGFFCTLDTIDIHKPHIHLCSLSDDFDPDDPKTIFTSNLSKSEADRIIESWELDGLEAM